MALQDLTPQLRTRLSRHGTRRGLVSALRHAVIASLLCYTYTAPPKQSWFLKKNHYHTSISSGAG